MVGFKSHKFKKLQKQKKNKTMHTKYKHRHRTIKQPKHKSYRANRTYYDINNNLAGIVQSQNVVFNNDLDESKHWLSIIFSQIYQEATEVQKNDYLEKLYSSYNRILSYEDKQQFMDEVNEMLTAQYNPTQDKNGLRDILLRIEERERRSRVIALDIPQKNILLTQITSNLALIDLLGQSELTYS